MHESALSINAPPLADPYPRANSMKEFLAPDGVRWGVEIRSPGASHAMIVFHHPAAGTSRLNRYAWHNWKGPESRNVTARLDEAQVMETLGDRDIARLFRRAMPVSTPY